MLTPIGITQIGVADGTAAVDHHAVADIDTAVCDTFHTFAHSAVKEDNISGPYILDCNIPAEASQTLRPQAACVVHAAVGENITDEA